MNIWTFVKTERNILHRLRLIEFSDFPPPSEARMKNYCKNKNISFLLWNNIMQNQRLKSVEINEKTEMVRSLRLTSKNMQTERKKKKYI